MNTNLDSSGAIPDELQASVDHLATIMRQIARLEEARQEAVAQLVVATGRLAPLGFEEANALHVALQETKVPGRRDVLQATGWNHQQLARFRRDGLPPRGIACVYLLLDGTEVVYVGRSGNARQRLKAHRKEKAGLWDEYQVFVCRDLNDARDLEAVLIRQHAPRLNQRFKNRAVA